MRNFNHYLDIIQENKSDGYVYHITLHDNLKSILKYGLKANQKDYLILSGKEWNKVYGKKPIYVSTDIKKNK